VIFPCKFASKLLSLSMETKKKAGTLAVAASIPNEKKEPKLRMVNTKKNVETKTTGEKPKGLNLDETIKVIDALFQKKRHRDRLDHYIEELSKFEIDKKNEDLDNQSSYYNRCTLLIKDDKNGSFELKNPTIITEVVDFIKGRFSVKLAEIESELVLPA